MLFRVFTQQVVPGSWKGVVDEVLDLVQNGSPDAKLAGLDFSRALKTMANSQILMAQPVPTQVWVNLFSPSWSLWSRHVRKHSLYLSYYNNQGITQKSTEIRALLACNGLNPESVRVKEASDRHSKM